MLRALDQACAQARVAQRRPAELSSAGTVPIRTAGTTTDRDKIMLIVEPVVIRPWLAEWAAEKAEIAVELKRADTAKSPATRTKRRNEADRRTSTD